MQIFLGPERGQMSGVPLSPALIAGISLLVMVCFDAALAGPIAVESGKDEAILKAMLGHVDAALEEMTREHFAAITVPDTLCWTDFPKMNAALTAYQFTEDQKYLRGFVGAMENVMACSQTGPDGYEGWYGEPHEIFRDPANPNVRVGEIATDFRATAMVSRFAEIVNSDPALEKAFGVHRDKYVKFAEDHLVKKWDGSFVDLGERGAVYRSNKEYKPAFASMSLPQEKVSIMMEGLMGLYRATGNYAYAEKGAKLGLWFKRCLEFDGRRYSWNRWNPAGEWDVSPANPAKWTSWIAKEPKGIWHSASVGSAVLLYHHGLVFDRQDMERFLKTQVVTCWNGDLENPQYFTVDGMPARDGEVIAASSLCAFDENYARLHFQGKAQDRRIEKSGGAWQGGVVAADWLMDKYVLSRSASPRYEKKGKDFLDHADPELLRELSFEVKPPGYMTPPSPTPEVLAEMAGRSGMRN